VSNQDITEPPAWVASKKSVRSWLLYDMANTIFAFGVTGLYFAEWITSDQGRKDSYLAFPTSAAMILIIFLGPWTGAKTDHSGRRVPTIIWGTIATVTATFFLGTGPIGLSVALYMLALIGFNLASIAYDAMLPDIADGDIGKISGRGVAVGYLGSFVGFGLGYLMLDRLDLGYEAVFKAIAVAFLALALPIFFTKERPRQRSDAPAPRLRDVLQTLLASWAEAKKVPGMRRYLVGRFMYTDAINTLIGGFLAIFVIQELDFTPDEVIVLLSLSITFAILGGYLASILVDRVGARRYVHAMLYLWMFAIAAGVGAAVFDLGQVVWIFSAAGGIALGGLWASDRTYLADLAPPDQYGLFFGLYGTVGRFATVVGPLVWAFIVDGLELPRTYAMGSLILALVVARIILQKVPRLGTA
jgi:UMF1 family MFS transporter